MGKRAAIVGTGQTYHKSIRRDVNGQELINEAVTRALEDAELTIDDIDGVVMGNMDHFEGINYTDCWSVDGSGAFMKPLIKLCTGGTTGTTLAIGGYHMVAAGMFDKLLVIGWEKNSESDTTGAIVTATDPILDRGVMAGALAGLASHAVLDAIPHYDHPDWRVELSGGIASLILLLLMPFASGPAVVGGLMGMVPDLENLFQKLGWIGRHRFVFPSHTGLVPHGRELGPRTLVWQALIFVACFGLLGLLRPQAASAARAADGTPRLGRPATTVLSSAKTSTTWKPAPYTMIVSGPAGVEISLGTVVLPLASSGSKKGGKPLVLS